MLVSIAVVGGAAAYYSNTVSSHGTWAAVGSWSLTALYVVGALVGGALAGVLSAAQRTVERLELTLRDWLHALPAMQSASTSVGRSLATARQEYETMVEDLNVYFEVGKTLSAARQWPQWGEASEFRAARAASASERAP